MGVRERVIGPDGVVVGAESIELDTDGDRGVLLLHGFNDTPQSVQALAQSLHATGWGVHAPLLAHHGRTSEEFAARATADDWIAQVRSAWATVRARYPYAVLVGQSMGGALAVVLAAEAPPRALVLLAPYLRMSLRVRLLSRFWPIWQLVMPRLRSNPERGLHDVESRGRSLGGEYFTPRTVAELKRVVDSAARASSAVLAPTLVIHARQDYRIPSPSALRGFARLGSSDRTLVWRDNVGHVVAADRGRELLFATIEDWLESVRT